MYLIYTLIKAWKYNNIGCDRKTKQCPINSNSAAILYVLHLNLPLFHLS